MDEYDYKSLINYYGREKFYQSMQNCCLEALTKFPGQNEFRLFNGISLVLGNRIQEGIRELTPIKNERDLSMAAVIALIYAHKRCTVIDKEALVSLDGKLKEERKKLNGNSTYYASFFLFHCGKIDKSREYCEKSLKYNPENIDAMVLRGWCDLLSPNRVSRNILETFSKSLTFGRNLDANLGQVKFHQLNNDFEAAISVLNQLAVRYNELNIPLIEKMKNQLANWSWEHSLESSYRILDHEPMNIEALRVKILIMICRDGIYTESVGPLQYLYKSLEKYESANCELFYRIGQLFSRICGRNHDILQETLKMIEKASSLAPNNPDYITELGYHSIYLNRIKDAIKYFRSATKLDDSSVYALCGLTLCQLLESGATEQVNQQIEFLNEIQGGNKIPLLLYMSSKLVTNDADKSIAFLIESCEIQFRNLKTLSFGPEYLRKFNPDFLLQITKQLLHFAPVQSIENFGGTTIVKDNIHISLKQSLNILESIVKACPGFVQGIYQLARVQFLCNELTKSSATLQRILQQIDPTFTDAQLLMAQIHICTKNYQRALQCLEICLSHDFKVRENPLFHLLTGIVQKHQQNYENCIKSFLNSMNQTINLDNRNLQQVSPTKKIYLPEIDKLCLSDKVTLYLELIDAYTVMDQANEASKWMQSAIDEFSTTPESGRLIIANANLMLQHGNVSKCLDLLKTIDVDQPYFLQAKTKMAHVYLHNLKDRLGYTQCFKELVANVPGPESYLLLGDAFMSIQEPEQAIDAYREALKQSPYDPMLANKLGRAYVKTHQYVKAINYYKDATSSSENFALKLDLAELYLKLKQYSNAEQTLVDEIEITKKSENEDTSLLQMRTKQLLLLARVREKAGHLSASLSTLKEARDNQYRIQKRIKIENLDLLDEQNRLLSKICVLMAEQAVGLRDNDQGIQYYKEALKNTPDDVVIMASLSKLYMQVNNMEQCQHTCNAILQIETNNEIASVMMADLSFRRMDFDNAAYHFSQLLLSQPTYWTALARLIEVMRRSAALIDVLPFIERAEQATNQQPIEAGLSYCKGLYDWYTGNPNSALRFFNTSRRDNEWGQQSIFNMIDICLNPDGDLPTEVTLDSIDDHEFRDSRSMALRTAERLLKELKPRPGGIDNEALNHRLLENFLLLASKQKYNIENALQDLTTIASQDEYKEHVGPIYGMASAHIMLKQTQRAKNQLKRVSKNQWTFEDAEYLERCWLLLADIYIQANKFEIASDLLQRILEHNKSCAKAYELCGFISEKEQAYRAASIHYDSAWKFGGKLKPGIGYKLAYNHMKTKNYADAIDVCQQVLKIHPDYPSIKKDILDKCRNNLKS